MVYQSTLLGEGGPAGAADEGPLPRVGPLVLLQVVRQLELLAAEWAGERAQGGVFGRRRGAFRGQEVLKDALRDEQRGSGGGHLQQKRDHSPPAVWIAREKDTRLDPETVQAEMVFLCVC